MLGPDSVDIYGNFWTYIAPEAYLAWILSLDQTAGNSNVVCDYKDTWHE